MREYLSGLATALRILKNVIYGKLIAIPLYAWYLGAIRGIAMIAGTYAAERLISNMSNDKFQKYVAVLLCIVGLYMLVIGS